MAGPSAVPRSQRDRSANDKQPYESLQFALSSTGQGSLNQLGRSHGMTKLKEQLVSAQQMMSVTAGELNDRVTTHEQLAKHRNKIKDIEASEDDAEQKLTQLKGKVESMTDRMEESMRKLIDGEHTASFIQGSLEAAAGSRDSDHNSHIRSQMPPSQRTRNRHPNHLSAEYDESSMNSSNASGAQFEPTDPTEMMDQSNNPIDAFRRSLDQAKLRYQASSRTARYAGNNRYREFRGTVHDARFPNDEMPPIPPDQWFGEEGVPPPGITGRLSGAGDQDPDDDIAISRASTSIKCPLTLQDFKEPLSSTKCPHSFESQAILNMIKASNQRTNDGRPGVQCPVPGCAEILSKADLHIDPVLVRKIRRIQRAMQLGDEDETGDGETRNAHSHRIEDLDDLDVDVDDPDDISRTQSNLKRE